MQNSLFEQADIHIPLPDGELNYCRHWLEPSMATSVFESLKQHVKWEQSLITIYGREVSIPRLNAWYGDEGCDYQYSGRRFNALPWLPELSQLREKLQQHTQQGFNSVLVNLYRDGNDSVAWHSDDEPELGKNPVIASVSLGGSRKFQLKHKYDSQIPQQQIDLEHGSLLIMSGGLQHYWSHQIPKTQRHVGPRINLTFRKVLNEKETKVL